MKFFATLQSIGRALMMPIAVLPVAALLLRLGQPDLFDLPFVSAAGLAVFDNMGLLFAAGIATGLARDHHGAAALAGVVCYLISTHGAGELLDVASTVPENIPDEVTGIVLSAYKKLAIARLSVPIGIISGLLAGTAYNRYSAVALPEFLAFFGGRRFVLIVCGLAGIALALAIGSSYDALDHGMDTMSRAILDSGHWGPFLYGVLNRLLIITGLHHILNNLAWFSVGEFHGKTGDLVRFFAGDPDAGAFMTGFYPVMMFGLPAACLAMYHSIPKDNRKTSVGLLASIAFTSLLTGVTEPVEFSFMFLAPGLYVIHALLTGTAMLITSLLDIRLGFGFSAGLIDYVLNYRLATNPLLLLAVGVIYAGIYYALFRVVISAFNIATPGRSTDTPVQPEQLQPSDRAAAFLDALGGADNLNDIDACTTRLRLSVKSCAVVDDNRLKQLGARGVIRPSGNTVQVVLGPHAETVADEMRRAASARKGTAPLQPAIQTAAETGAAQLNIQPWLNALGGHDNIVSLEGRGSRIRVALSDIQRVDIPALEQLGARGHAALARNVLHILLNPSQVAAVVGAMSARN